jgi:hypothetical protein
MHRVFKEFDFLYDVSNKEYRQATYLANRLNTLSSIMYRDGKIALHHSFDNIAKDYRYQATLYKNDMDFFDQQRNTVQSYIRDILNIAYS